MASSRPSSVPDLEVLEETHVKLGGKHAVICKDVKPHHFSLVGEALLYALEMMLEDDFSEHARESWTIFYRVLSYNMINGLRLKEKALAIQASSK